MWSVWLRGIASASDAIAPGSSPAAGCAAWFSSSLSKPWCLLPCVMYVIWCTIQKTNDNSEWKMYVSICRVTPLCLIRVMIITHAQLLLLSSWNEAPRCRVDHVSTDIIKELKFTYNSLMLLHSVDLVEVWMYRNITWCQKWDRQHEYKQCPAYGKTCNYCQKQNHFEVCCRRKLTDLHFIETDTQEQEYYWLSSTFDILCYMLLIN